MTRFLIACIAALAASVGMAQQPVTIQVDAASRQGALRPIFSYFGYDEPNYTYMPNGAKLIGELARLSYAPVYIRAHHLLVTGDGTPALKWGSTNAYTEDAQGKPVYNWTIVDRIFDTYIHAGAKPFVEIGFMPEALSTHPEPYTRHWPKPDDGKGWSYPPKDYDKWSELVRQWVLHSVERYGRAQVESWYWEVWNEPDISYWRGTPEEYDKLYDAAAAGVKKALPSARIGGPGITGPSGRSAGYLDQFLAHCRDHKTPLDFITYHAKGSPKAIESRMQMGLQKELRDVDGGMQVINRYPAYTKLPIILSEADPEGCAACSAREYPNNAYRNDTLYPTYTAVALSNILKLADRNHSNMEGMLTWAFEFENRDYFEGFRTLATNGIDKPVLNVFRMFGLLQGDRLKVDSTGAVGLDHMLQAGVREKPDIDALAARSDRTVSILVWNYHDDEVPAPASPIELNISGLNANGARVQVRHYRLDHDHSNAYTAWKQMGSPEHPSPEQYARLEAAGQLELLTSPAWLAPENGKLKLPFDLPRQALSLIQVSW